MQADWEQFAIKSQQAICAFGSPAEFEATIDSSIPDEIIDYTGGGG